MRLDSQINARNLSPFCAFILCSRFGLSEELHNLIELLKANISFLVHLLKIFQVIMADSPPFRLSPAVV